MQKKLNELLKNSYSPYSKVKVSAILITNDNQEFYGVNIENASFTPTICAERNAIFQAVSKGYKKGDFKEIHLTSSTKSWLFPCGVCRQVMTEFFDEETKVITWNNNQKNIKFVKELMPFSVTNKDLD